MYPGIDYILFFIGLIGLSVGTFTDFKRREVPDLISYGMVFAGLGLRLLYSAVTFEWSYFLYGLLGFGIFFLIALGMFYAGQWGGGDSKVLMGMGALFGTTPVVALYSDKTLPYLNYQLPFLAHFFINTLIVGAVYGMVWGVIVIILHWQGFVKQAKVYFADRRIRLIRLIVLIVSGLLLLAGFFVHDIMVRLLIVVLVVFVFFGFYFMVFIKALEKGCMIKKVSPSFLTEGDWIVDEIKAGKRLVCGPKDLGISLKQIEEVKKLYKQGKIKEVTIKTGIPFVPSFLMAFVFTVIWGNVFYLFF